MLSTPVLLAAFARGSTPHMSATPIPTSSKSTQRESPGCRAVEAPAHGTRPLE